MTLKVRLLFLLTTLIAGLSPTVSAQPLPVLSDLPQDIRQAGDRFMLVLVSQPGCHYCELVKEEVLEPMQLSGRYDDKLLFRNLIIFDDREVTDANGGVISATGLARRFNSNLTPTLLFIDPETGTEVAEKIIGVSNIEMYGFYVDKRVEQARLAQASLQPQH